MGFLKYRSSPTSEWQEIYSIKGDTPIKGVDYYTEEEKQELIATIQESIVGAEINLSNYYTKSETDTKISDGLNGYATETYVDNKVLNAKPDLTNYYNKTEVDALIKGLATEEYVNNALGAIENGTY